MTRPAHYDDDGRPHDKKARVLIAATPRVEDLRDAVIWEVTRHLAVGIAGLRIGSTSLDPRDAAARATRWVARIGSRRGVPTSAVSPSSPMTRSWSVDPLRGPRRSQADSGIIGVGISRLDLSPVAAAVAQPYAMGVWLPLESRRQRLRRRFGSRPDVQLVEAALGAKPAATVLVGHGAGMAIAIVGDDLIATEVTGRAVRAAAQPVGDPGFSPWEAPVVQRGIELGAGVNHPDAIAVESVWLGDPRDRSHDQLHRIVDTATARIGFGGSAARPASPVG